MPEKRTLERARRDKRAGKPATTQAGEFVREEMHHVKEGKHGARSQQQIVAIGLSKARRAGVKLPSFDGTRTRKSTTASKGKARTKSTARSRAKRSPRGRSSRSR
jgi:hypothetical protein